MISVVSAVALLISQPTENTLDAASSFIMCAGLFDAAGDEYERRGQPMTAEEYRGASRGSRVVAEFMLIDTIADAERRAAFLDAGYENAFIRHSAAAERGEIIREEAQLCFDLQPLQIEVLETLRRKAYSKE